MRNTTQHERDDVVALCKAELAKPDLQNWPDFVTVTLHATGVLALLAQFEEMRKLLFLTRRLITMDHEFTSRYEALGMEPPDPATMCTGQCEGTGWVPVSRDDPEEPFHALWLAAEAVEPTDDGWHFVQCPECKGSGLKAA